MVKSTILRTSVDDLYDLVASQGKISIDDAAKTLKLPINVTHALVDFLVEEKLFGIEYKFTTPFVYINKKRDDLSANTPSPKLHSKDQFFEISRSNGITPDKIQELWSQYLQKHLPAVKEDFFTKARSRNIPTNQIEALWEKYVSRLS